MIAKTIRRLFKKMLNRLPGNKYEKQALIIVLKIQSIVFLISVGIFLIALMHSPRWIYLIPFLYAAFSALEEAIPIVLQDHHAPNRFVAPTTLMLIFIYTLFICFVGAGVSIYFELHLIYISLMAVFYIKCIYISFKSIK